MYAECDFLTDGIALAFEIYAKSSIKYALKIHYVALSAQKLGVHD
jgi:hypothetical protein